MIMADEAIHNHHNLFQGHNSSELDRFADGICIPGMSIERLRPAFLLIVRVKSGGKDETVKL